MAGFALQTPQDDVGAASRADAVFGMFEESAFSDIGDIWAFFSDDPSQFDGDDSFSAFMSDFGLPVEPPVARAAPVQSIADLALAVRLETERMEAGSRAVLPDRRALPMSAPARGRKKKRAATGGLFDALPLVEAAPQDVGVPRPVGRGPVFPDPALFVQVKPKGRAGRASAQDSLPKPVDLGSGTVGALAAPPLPKALPVDSLPVFAPVSTGGKKTKKAVSPPSKAAVTGGLFDLLSVPTDVVSAPSLAPADTALPDAPILVPAAVDRSPQSPMAATPAVSSMSRGVLDLSSAREASPPPAVMGDKQAPAASVPAMEASPSLSVTKTDAVESNPQVSEVVKTDDSPSTPPAAPAVPHPAPPPSPAPVLAGRPMPARSRAAQVTRTPAPFPQGDDDRVDFSQAIQPTKPKGWPSKREPGAVRPVRPSLPGTASTPSVVPPAPSASKTPASTPSPVAPRSAPPVVGDGTDDSVDFFTEFDGLWDGDEA